HGKRPHRTVHNEQGRCARDLEAQLFIHEYGNEWVHGVQPKHHPNTECKEEEERLVMEDSGNAVQPPNRLHTASSGRGCAQAGQSDHSENNGDADENNIGFYAIWKPGGNEASKKQESERGDASQAVSLTKVNAPDPTRHEI